MSSCKRLGATRWWIAALLVAIAGLGALGADWYRAEPPEALAKAKYLGRSACIDCHQSEHTDFVGSHHDRAMELATEEAVIGDFNNTEFTRLGVTTRFFRRGDEYWVNAEGPDGELHDYQIKYTFGIDPLQQYMVQFPDGRVQVLRVSWDTHKKQWFYVPPPDSEDLRLEPGDPMHWTGIAQNWNTTCAECHSTDLQKNYNLADDTYATTFSEIDVSCEACHGPGSLHVKLAGSRSLFWDRRHGYGLAKLKSTDTQPQLDTCAKCHSRRTAVHPEFRPGSEFADSYNVALLHEGIYHADGQIQDEDYVYGSFLQSRMFREGVRCTDCHNPHSLELKFEGNALCSQCHVPSKYDSPAHHHHKMDTPGASCVECHMPATTYMVVDPRRDHSIRMPRPDLTVAHGVPNACNNCHTKEDESAEWAAAKVVEWYGAKRRGDPHWTAAIAGGRELDPDAEQNIIDAIARQQTPDIVKATLCELLGQYPTPEADAALAAALRSPSDLVRRAAVASVPITAEQHITERLVPALSDPVRSVRVSAVVRMLQIPPALLGEELPEGFRLALDEYKQQLGMQSERAGSHQHLAGIAQWSGNASLMVEELQAAIRLAPYLAGPREELAQLLSTMPGNEAMVRRLRLEAIERLERDAKLLPEAGDIRYRLGLLQYQVDNLEQAEQRLTEAVELEPKSPTFVLGLACLFQEQFNRGDEQAFDHAVDMLRKLRELVPDSDDPELVLREMLGVRQQRKAAEKANEESSEESAKAENDRDQAAQ